MKSKRRQAREQALQVLYQLDLNHDLTPEAALFYFERHFFSQSQDVYLDPFTQSLVSGVMNHLQAMDLLIEGASSHWRTDRMPVIDKNILRIGIYELKFCDDIPATVTINEMVEIAKAYGSENSPSFVNGILDQIKAGLNSPNKSP